MLTHCLQGAIVTNVDNTSTEYIVLRGDKKLVDTQYLELVIRNSGKRKNYLSEKIGCSRQYFMMKINNKAPFNTDEVAILCEELNITKLKEKEKIFFATSVDKMSTN